MIRQMKESNVQWMGVVPMDWNIVRLKSCIAERDGGAWGDEANGESGDTICLRIADFNYSTFRFKDSPIEELTKRNYKPEVIQKLKLRKNDIVIEKSGGGEKTPVGRTVIFDKDYEALYANFCDRLRCRDIVIPEFLQYVFATFYANKYVWNYIKQTTGIQNLDLTSMLSSEKVALPSIEEQKRIVDFLNRECHKIDTIIQKSKDSIQEYRDFRQATIDQAVTKGLDSKREFVDSGIPWVSKLPKGWNPINPKALFSQRKDKANEGERQLTASQQYGIMFQDDYMELTGARVVVVEKDFSILKHVEAGDFVISMRSFQGGLEYSTLSGSISSAYVMLIPNLELVYPRFYRWLLKSSVYINALQSTSNLVRDGQAMRYSNFAQVRLFTVPIEEQKSIANYLEDKCRQIDSLIKLKEEFIEELENYKKSFIYEYVTGKKEVPRS